jgi:SAM-dependent methyltransferase
MRTLEAGAAEAALTQPLMEQLLADAGVSRGMRVLVLGRGLAELALLVAERVGSGGAVLGIGEHSGVVDAAKRRAADEGFEHVEFRAGALGQIALDGSIDAVVGRSFLTYEREPLEALRLAARAVHDGGRIIFQEWHFDSMRWAQTSHWPHVPLYSQFARSALEGLRRRRAHLDMGLRLVNLFTEAGLALPMVCTDLRTIHGADSLGYAFFEATLRELLTTIERYELANAICVDVDTFAERLQRETTAAGGHLFLPLQVGAWTRACVPS